MKRCWIGVGSVFSRESGNRQTVFRTAQPDNHQFERLKRAIATESKLV
jgi:hypothetical protein